jgi:hypothetical protein
MVVQGDSHDLCFVPPFTLAQLQALMSAHGLSTPEEVDKKYGLPIGSTAQLMNQP